MTFALTGWMLYSMWAVLGLMGLSFLMDLFRALKAGGFSHSLILSYLQDMVYYVLPLILLANMQSLDPTGWLLLLGYYIGALGVVLKYLFSLFRK